MPVSLPHAWLITCFNHRSLRQCHNLFRWVYLPKLEPCVGHRLTILLCEVRQECTTKDSRAGAHTDGGGQCPCHDPASAEEHGHIFPDRLYKCNKICENKAETQGEWDSEIDQTLENKIGASNISYRHERFLRPIFRQIKPLTTSLKRFDAPIIE